MFGYVRPKKADLLMREFTRYRAVYCGLCKALSDNYGQVPRMALTYDFTFFALLFLGLSADDAALSMEGCLLNPIQKKPISRHHGVLDLAADYSVLLAGYQVADDLADQGGLKARLRQLAFHRAFKRAKRKQPETATAISGAMKKLNTAEASQTQIDPPVLARYFGDLLAILFDHAACLIEANKKLTQALALIGRDMGAWIYIVDAIDDMDEDKAKGQFNALSAWSELTRKDQADNYLISLEASLDRTLALLPYYRDGGIMRNIALAGLPDVREAVLAGRALKRI